MKPRQTTPGQWPARRSTSTGSLPPMPAGKERITDKLLPCPFCGSNDVSKSQGRRANGSSWFYIECKSCSACAELDFWNRRAAPEAETSASASGAPLPTGLGTDQPPPPKTHAAEYWRESGNGLDQKRHEFGQDQHPIPNEIKHLGLKTGGPTSGADSECKECGSRTFDEDGSCLGDCADVAASACPGCEGRPASENDTCGVCGAQAAPLMLNGLTEAETSASASVAGLSLAAPVADAELPPLPEQEARRLVNLFARAVAFGSDGDRLKTGDRLVQALVRQPGGEVRKPLAEEHVIRMFMETHGSGHGQGWFFMPIDMYFRAAMSSHGMSIAEPVVVRFARAIERAQGIGVTTTSDAGEQHGR